MTQKMELLSYDVVETLVEQQCTPYICGYDRSKPPSVFVPSSKKVLRRKAIVMLRNKFVSDRRRRSQPLIIA